MSLRIATYNILADAYIRPDWYRHVEPACLNPDWRGAALIERIAGVEADLLGLQEVEPAWFDQMSKALEDCGYASHYAQKRGRPDGCAIVYRRSVISPLGFEALYFNDGQAGEAPSGHLALIGQFQSPLGRLSFACTHLRWAPDELPAADHIGYRQALELLARLGPNPMRWVLCGDLNGIESSAPIRALRAAGLRDAFATTPQPTCNPNHRCKRIDYLFHTLDICAVVDAPAVIRDDTPLPSRGEPSDHLPLMAEFSLA